VRGIALREGITVSDVERRYQLLGDLDRAVALARELGGLPPSDRPRLVHYPKEAGLMDVIEERSGLLAALGAEWARSLQLPQRGAWSVLDLQLEP
jgi:hypothetical protein